MKNTQKDRTLSTHFHHKKVDIHEKVSFHTGKKRKNSKSISMKICVEGMSFVHCHLMECNSRWNKRMTYKKGKPHGENTTFYISNKGGGFETFFI